MYSMNSIPMICSGDFFIETIISRNSTQYNVQTFCSWFYYEVHIQPQIQSSMYPRKIRKTVYAIKTLSVLSSRRVLVWAAYHKFLLCWFRIHSIHGQMWADTIGSQLLHIYRLFRQSLRVVFKVVYYLAYGMRDRWYTESYVFHLWFFFMYFVNGLVKLI